MTTEILEQKEVTLDDLNYFEAEDGLYIFMADRDDICDVIENIGFQIYYLLSNKIVKTQTNTNNKHANNGKTDNTSTYGSYTQPKAATPPPPPVKNFAIYKVCNTFVGRTVQEAKIALPDNFVSIDPVAHYSMPLIPTVIIDKLDQFFRLVDAQHGTESIVLLTYDMNSQGSEGWGVLVPDQENTPAHCNYDPQSIVDIKPDNVMIVGSVHSHPHMAAYASGTDHADQADFDGIHITYGWQKSVNNGATQYHIELQMSGEAYTLKPEDVFEDYVINKEPDPDVVEWSGRVKKELPPLSPAGGSRTTVLGNPPTQPLGKTEGVGNLSHWTHSSFFNQIKDQLVTPCLIAYEIPYTIYDLQNNKISCMVCGVILDHYSVVDHICDICSVPVFTKDEPIQTVIEEMAYYAYQSKIELDVPVYMFGTSSEGFYISRITPTTLKDYLNVDKFEEIVASQDDKESIPDYQSPVCCNAVDIANCYCDNTVTVKDFGDFLDIAQMYDFYSKESTNPCLDCSGYLDQSCPYLVDIASNFMKMKSEDPTVTEHELEAAEGIIDGTDCLYFEKYSYNDLEENDLGGWNYD